MNRTKGRPKKRPEKEFFEKLYDNKDISIDEIAKLFNVNKQTVYNWAQYFRKENKVQ